MKSSLILVFFGLFSLEVSAQQAAKPQERAQQKVMVYPSIAHNELNFSGIQAGNIITLMDSSGKEVMRHSAANPDFQWKVGHLPKGTYLLKITTKEGGEGTSKILKD